MERWDVWYELLKTGGIKKCLQKGLTKEKAEAQANKMRGFFIHKKKWEDGTFRVYIKLQGEERVKLAPFVYREPHAWVYDEIGRPIGDFPLEKAFEMVNQDNDWTIGDIQ